MVNDDIIASIWKNCSDFWRDAYELRAEPNQLKEDMNHWMDALDNNSTYEKALAVMKKRRDGQAQGYLQQQAEAFFYKREKQQAEDSAKKNEKTEDDAPAVLLGRLARPGGHEKTTGRASPVRQQHDPLVV